MNYKHILPVVCLLSAVSLMGWGCNPFKSAQDKVNEKIGEAVAENALSKLTGGKVDVSQGGKQVVVENKEGSVMAFGEEVKIPDTYPKDVPIYPGAKATGVIMSNEADKASSLTMETADAMDKVSEWYASSLKTGGFTEESTYSSKDTQFKSYTKDKVRLTLTFSKDSSTSKTMITVVRSEEQSSDN